MKPSDYVATTRITNRAGEVTAAVGETCERVDPGSLPWLLEAGAIAPVEKKPAKARATEGKE